MTRLEPATRVGKGWAQVARVAESYRRAGHVDVHRLWPVGAIPAVPGPVVYAVVGFGRVQYVGQTRDQLRQRISRHLREPAKAHTWAYVAAIALSDDVPLLVIDAVEREAQRLLDPQMGSAWPRRRNRDPPNTVDPPHRPDR